MMRRADAAMHRAKERGRDRYDIFDSDLHDRTEARQVLVQAMRDGLHMSLAVNISARELTGRNLRNRVEQALRRHDFDPARLILEITESSILRARPASLLELEELLQRGVRVAIDDFGTAYATLRNLTILPVDVLKVDTSFTAGLPDQRTHTAIVHGIASMAYELDIP